MFGLKRYILVTAADYDRAMEREGIEIQSYQSGCLQCIAASMREQESYRVIDMAAPRVEAFRGSRHGNHALLLGKAIDGVAWDVRIELDEIHLAKQTKLHEHLSADDAVAAAESILSQFRRDR